MNKNGPLVGADVDITRGWMEIEPLPQKVGWKREHTSRDDEVCNDERRLIHIKGPVNLIERLLYLRQGARAAVHVEKLAFHVRPSASDSKFGDEALHLDRCRLRRFLVQPAKDVNRRDECGKGMGRRYPEPLTFVDA